MTPETLETLAGELSALGSELNRIAAELVSAHYFPATSGAAFWRRFLASANTTLAMGDDLRLSARMAHTEQTRLALTEKTAEMMGEILGHPGYTDWDGSL